MARLVDDGIGLNLMSLEALAAAEHIGAEFCLATGNQNPPLLAAEPRAHKWEPTDDPCGALNAGLRPSG